MFPDSDIDVSAQLCSLHVLRSSGADRVSELYVVVTNLVLPRYFASCLLAERDAFALLVEKYWELVSRKSDMAS